MTNNLITILFLSIIGGLIGWITNILAIKLLFRPLKPVKIPFLKLEIIGLIPKRQKEIAKNIGQVISTELLSVEDLFNDFINDDGKREINETIKEKLINIIAEKINFIPAPFNLMIKGYVDDIIDKELDTILKDLHNIILSKAKEKINIEKIVEEKINLLDLNKLESIILSVAQKELKHIEILGFILGALIGLIQSLVIIFIK